MKENFILSLMDRITSGLLVAFKKELSLSEDLNESELFEHFVNYCIVSKEFSGSFSLEDIFSGGGGDKALDGIGILVNGSLVNSQEELEDLEQVNRYLDVDFLLIQAKSSSRFDSGDIAKFILGAQDFFKTSPKLPTNEQVRSKAEIVKLIYEKSSRFKNRNPVCKLYYVTTGKWVDDEHLLATINSLTEGFEDIFEKIEFKAIDANELQNLYRFINNKISREILFERRTALPAINDVKEAYIGVLSAREYLDLITDESGNIIRGLFYDNVRDFQGENEVNEEIGATIRFGDHSPFVFYNNGITIIAEDVNAVGDRVTISDYQIVNGCQTSYVLHANRSSITSSLYIPVKLIELDRNSNIKNKIIKANNRQTPVKLEELEALTDFQKRLEEYYNSLPEERRLYYERRPKQYNGLDIYKIKVVDISSQIRCFSSMFLDQAHNAGRYYAKLLDDIRTKIFLPSHDPIGYYVSVYTKFRLDEFFKKRQLESKYQPFRYHILNIFRMQVSGLDMPDLSSNRFTAYCKKMEETLWDDDKCRTAFLKASTVIDSVVNSNYDRALAKTVTFAKAVKDSIRQSQ